jgi:hypothetical protein
MSDDFDDATRYAEQQRQNELDTEHSREHEWLVRRLDDLEAVVMHLASSDPLLGQTTRGRRSVADLAIIVQDLRERGRGT